jgi:predicted  nucleic acid-binding Zn-ribbon protein
MTEQTGANLEELQRIDQRIEAVKEKMRTFDPLLEEVDAPAAELEDQVENTRGRLQEMKVDERRVELAAQEKKNRADRLEERLKSVRNVREEAAVSAELDMVRRALEGEEQEALTLLDQIRKMELRLEELEEALEEELEDLRARRERFSESMDDQELRVYERIRGGSGRRAVARLTADGACGNCFNMIPLQLQNEIRHGSEMIRCEACGVILAAADAGQEDGTE